MDALRLPLALVAETPSELELGRYLTTCGLLVGLIVGLGWLFRRFIGGALKKRASQRSLQVVDVLPLGGRQKLCVVRCYDRTLVLGLGSDVSLVAELDPESVELPEAKAAEPVADRRAFARELLRVHAELIESEEAPSAARPSKEATPKSPRPPQPTQAPAKQSVVQPARQPASATTRASTTRPKPATTSVQSEPRRTSARPEPQEVQRLREALRGPEGVLG